MSYISKISDGEWKYPPPALNRSGMLAVSGGHRISWEEYGNAGGEPVMFLHGGPGGGCTPALARFFDPKRYRIILFDQRGCGKSVPNASHDPTAALKDNTTRHLIEDILALRRELGIPGKMHVFGGSWGSTLSLAYAVAHPETVENLILRGIFLCRRKDLDYFYQGNAATYHLNPNDTSLPGAYLSYPEAWKLFVEFIPAQKRHDMVKAYADIFAMNAVSEQETRHQEKAASAWSIWEGATSYLAQDTGDLGRFAEPDFAKAFARIENHYFMNGAFLGGSGEANRDNNFLLERIPQIKDIPVAIVHGRYDQVCPLFQAQELVAALEKAGSVSIDYRIPPAAHSMTERENCLALVDIMDHLPPMKKF